MGVYVGTQRWLCQGNVFVLICDLLQHVVPSFFSGHCSLGRWYGPVFIFLRCLWYQQRNWPFYETFFKIIQSGMCAVLVTCRSDEKSKANSRENYLVWENNQYGLLNDLGLFFYIHRKYFLQRPILLPMPPLICSNTHTLSLSLSLSLRYLALSPQLSVEYLTLSYPTKSIIE